MDPQHLPVLEAYENFIRAGAAAANRGEADDPELARYADGPALVSVRAAIDRNADNGRVYEGRPTIVSASVTHLDVEAPPEDPNASVTACVDISGYVVVTADDRSPVPVDRERERYVATADFWYTTDGRWVVITTEEHQEMPC